MSRTRDLGKIISGNFDVPAASLDNSATAVNNNINTLSVTRSNISDLGTGALSNRNLTINGAMQVAQRGTGVFTVNGDRPVDRWQMISNVNDFTTTQSLTVPVGKGFTKSVKIQPTATKSPSNSTYARIGYSIEGYDGASLCWGTSGAKSATISFWVRASVTGIYSIGVKNGSANRSICLEYTIDIADTWEYKTITFSGVTDGTWEQTNSRFCYIDVWQAGQGSQTSTIGTWQNQNTNMSSNQVNLFTSTSNTFYLTGFQMEVGDTATPFEHRSHGQELALCQRYYYRPADSGHTEQWPAIGLSNAGGLQIYVQHPVRMRSTCSVTFPTNPYWESNPWTSVGAAMTISNINIGHTGPDGGDIGIFQNNTVTRGQSYNIGTNGFEFDAEL